MIDKEKYEETEDIYGIGTIRFPECEGCGNPIKSGTQTYAVQCGYINGKGNFVREDLQSQLFHIDCI